MNDISMKRILRWTLASLIVMFIWSFVAGSGIASAETGTISILDSQTKTYDGAGGGGSNAGTPVWTNFYFSNTNYNFITSWYITVGDDSLFLKVSNSTEFTCSSGCSGTGLAWYSKSGKQIGWDFSNVQISASEFVLSYNVNIFDSSNIAAGVAPGTTSTEPSSTRPIGLKTSFASNKPLQYLQTGAPIVQITTQTAVVSNQVSENYNVTYPISGKFVVSIDKSGTTTTKNYFNNSSSNMYQEASYNTVDFISPVLDYTTGLYINVYTSSGAFSNNLINSTGTTGIATPVPTATINPITGKGIIWDKSNYTLGETGTLSWAIGDSIWNLFSTQTVVIKKTDSGDVFTSVSSIAPQTGSYQFLFSNCASNEIICGYGTYQGIIYTNLFGLFETNREIATTQVFPASSSYILINSSVPIKTNITATIFIGQGGVLFGTLKTQFLQADNTYIDDRIWSTTLVSGTQNRTISFSKIGTYRLVVDDGGGGELATKLVTTFSSSVVPPYNVATSRIRLDRTAYNFDEILTGGYEVDNTNYSTGFPTYVDVFNYDINSITAEFYGQGFGLIPNWADTSLQVGSVGIPIQDSAPQKGFQGIRFVSGNNTIRLRINNVTSGISSTLAFYNFTISKLNVNGYSLEIIPNSVLKGTSVKISYVIPSASTITILSPSGKETNNAVAVSGAITYVPKELGAYYVYLKDSTNTIQVSRTLNVNAAPTISPTPSPDRGAGGILTIFDGWVALLGFGVSPLSKFFFAWLITTIFIVGGFATGRGMAAGTLLGAGAWGWFMAIGYLPQWFVIIVVLQLVLASRWFR